MSLAGAGAGYAVGATVESLGGLGETALREVAGLLKTPIHVEYGGYGLRLWGRWGRRGKQGTATYVRSVDIPLGVLLGALWVTGIWRPGGLLGDILGKLLSQAVAKPGEALLKLLMPIPAAAIEALGGGQMGGLAEAVREAFKRLPPPPGQKA